MLKKMSFLMLALGLMLSANAFACPGGQFRTLYVGDNEVGQIDMSKDIVKVLGSAELLDIVWISNAGERVQICPNSQIATCDFEQAIGIDLGFKHDSTLEIQIKFNNKIYTFVETWFVSRRGGCGSESRL